VSGPRRTGRASALASVLWAALALSCGGAPAHAPTAVAPAASAAAPAAPQAAFDPCTESKPLDKKYTGLLSAARCDQERFLIMAGVADQLGVQCTHCHVRSEADPKKLDYPVMTPHKEIAAWMHGHLMRAVKRADGAPMTCKSCHTDERHRPVAKILGEPRDVVRSQEWMTLHMVQDFVTARGERLKCKSCHVDNFTKPGWQSRVILRTSQIPPHE
jgi:cytochrome c